MSGIRWQENISPWKNGNVRLGLDYDSSSGSFKQTPAGMNMTFSNTLPTYQLTSPYVAVNHNFNLSQNWSLIPSVGVRGYFNNQYASQTAPFAGLSLVSQNVTFFANASKGVVVIVVGGKVTIVEASRCCVGVLVTRLGGWI